MRTGTIAFTLLALVAAVSPLGAQQPPAGDVARFEQRTNVLAAFNTLTANQKAAAWQRRVQHCLDA
jgi:hypothetical protein